MRVKRRTALRGYKWVADADGLTARAGSALACWSVVDSCALAYCIFGLWRANFGRTGPRPCAR